MQTLYDIRGVRRGTETPRHSASVTPVARALHLTQLHSMAPIESKLLTIQILQFRNGSYVTGIKEQLITSSNSTSTLHHAAYDGDGALMYVIAVILMYGFSILLMIGSSMRKSNNQDHAMMLYHKDNERVKNLERKQEKFKAKLLMHNKHYCNILGSDRADITLDQAWFQRHGISHNEKRMSISLDSFHKPSSSRMPLQERVLAPLVQPESAGYRKSRGAYSALDIYDDVGQDESRVTSTSMWEQEEEEEEEEAADSACSTPN